MLIVTEFKNSFKVGELYLYIYKDYGDNTLMLVRIKEQHCTSKWMDPHKYLYLPFIFKGHHIKLK